MEDTEKPGGVPFEALFGDLLGKGFKLALSRSPGKDARPYSETYDEDPFTVVRGTLWSHSEKKTNYRVGDKVLGFMEVENDKYLFVVAAEITSVPERDADGSGGVCGYAELCQFAPFLNRVVIRTRRKRGCTKWLFSLDNYVANNSMTASVLDRPYETTAFPGFNRIDIPFAKLVCIAEGDQHRVYREMLASRRGVYALKDTHVGKIYVGSAYGKDGLAQRWRKYLETCDGGNKMLAELYAREGREYFKRNFRFTVLETFDAGASAEDVVAAESFWKENLMTRKFGYNAN